MGNCAAKPQKEKKQHHLFSTQSGKNEQKVDIMDIASPLNMTQNELQQAAFFPAEIQENKELSNPPPPFLIQSACEIQSALAPNDIQSGMPLDSGRDTLGVAGGCSGLGVTEIEEKMESSKPYSGIENQEEEQTDKNGIFFKGPKQTMGSLDQQSTQFTCLLNDAHSKKDCYSQSETTTSKQKVKKCIKTSTHEQIGITVMVYEPTESSFEEHHSINEVEEFQEEDEEEKQEKEKKQEKQEEELNDPNEENAQGKNDHFDQLYDDSVPFTIFAVIADRNLEDMASRLSFHTSFEDAIPN